MKVLRSGRVPAWVRQLTIGCISLSLLGCGAVSSSDQDTRTRTVVSSSGGSSFGGAATERPLPPAACDRAPATAREAATLIVLDWDGGASPIDPGRSLDPLNPQVLPINSGVHTAAEADEFKEAVRWRVEEILCGLEPVDMRVIQGRAEDYPGATCVHLTLDISTSGGKQAGQADFDPCNRFPDDVAVIWAGRLVEAAGSGWSRTAWINMISNVTAHEIGHTLGFGHPDAMGLMIDSDRADQALMLSSHTIVDLAGQQAFLIPQSTCSEASVAAGSGIGYQIVGLDLQPFGPLVGPRLRTIGRETGDCPIITCPHNHDAAVDY